jgi:O-antigen/teichoic acid export membrane protein
MASPSEPHAAPSAANPPSPSLRRAVLTLLSGSALAQLLPLLLGPWLARLYSPAEFAVFTTFSALAANAAVVACWRYEQALPLAGSARRASELLQLCVWLWAAVVAFSALAAGLAWLFGVHGVMLFLPLAVGSMAWVQVLTLWISRTERFAALSWARVVQYGGAALLQGLAGWWAWHSLGESAGAWGLVLGTVSAGTLAAVGLMWAAPSPLGGWRALLRRPRRRWRVQARRWRDFPLFNAPHAFLGALQDTLTVLLLMAWAGDAAAGFWGLALRYLKAPATLVGGAVAQALYPRLARAQGSDAQALVLKVMGGLGALAGALGLVLLFWGPALFALAFGPAWREAGELARALALYIALHFVASPLSVVVMAWGQQAWALRLAVVGQLVFLLALALGLKIGGLLGGAWTVSVAMVAYFGYFFWALPRRAPRAAVSGAVTRWANE